MLDFHTPSDCTSALSLEFPPGTAQLHKEQSREAGFRGPQVEVWSCWQLMQATCPLGLRSVPMRGVGSSFVQVETLHKDFNPASDAD